MWHALSGGKLLLNEHVCILKIGVCKRENQLDSAEAYEYLPLLCHRHQWLSGKSAWLAFRKSWVRFPAGPRNFFQDLFLSFCNYFDMFVHAQDWNLYDEWNSFLLPPLPLAVMWTGVLLVGKLPLNEHACILNVGFLCEISFLLYLWILIFISFIHLVCCELVHCHLASCFWLDNKWKFCCQFVSRGTKFYYGRCCIWYVSTKTKF